MGESSLGALADRVKTDVRVPEDLSKTIDDLSHKLGLTKNAFYVLGAIKLASEITSMAYDKRTTKRLLTSLQKQIETMLAALENPAT